MYTDLTLLVLVGDRDMVLTNPRKALASLYKHLQSLKDQIKQLETTHDCQLVDLNIAISKVHEDTEVMVKMHEIKLENVAQTAEHSIQRMICDGNYCLKQLQESNAVLLKHLSLVQNQLCVTQQQLYGIQLTVTSSRLWVVSHDQFTIGKEIGRGTWTTVHETTFRGATVAAKCLCGVINTLKIKELLQQEMDMVLQCQHENIVTFLGATMEGAPVILMELMDVNLRIACKQESILDHQIHGILHDVAKALHFLHTRPDPVIHRDVSSANVLLKVLYNCKWLAKLGDLGTAKIQQQLATVVPGVIVYQAPEASDFKLHSPKMDVYSFGVVIIETLTKTHPFQMVDTLKVQVRQQFPQYYHLVTSCTKQKSGDRPTMYDVLVQLDKINKPDVPTHVI